MKENWNWEMKMTLSEEWCLGLGFLLGRGFEEEVIGLGFGFGFGFAMDRTSDLRFL
jgi:hypothetical protein